MIQTGSLIEFSHGSAGFAARFGIEPAASAYAVRSSWSSISARAAQAPCFAAKSLCAFARQGTRAFRFASDSMGRFYATFDCTAIVLSTPEVLYAD
jgi:hypothetical protein